MLRWRWKQGRQVGEGYENTSTYTTYTEKKADGTTSTLAVPDFDRGSEQGFIGC